MKRNKLFNSKSLLFSLFVLALIVRIAYVVQLEDQYYYYDTVHYDTAARHILSEQTFGPSLHYYGEYDHYALEAPFPIYLSFIYMIFGHSYLAVRLMNVLLSMIYLFILYQIARRFSKRVAVWALMIASLFPFFIYIAGLLYVTQLFALLLLLIVYFFLQYMETGRISHLALAAFFYALTIATRPVLLPSIPLVLLWVFFARDIRFTVKMFRVSLLAIIILIVLTPWTYRNYKVFGVIAPGRACLAEANIFQDIKYLIERKESVKQKQFTNRHFSVKVNKNDTISSWEFFVDDSSFMILEPYTNIKNTRTPYLGLLIYGDSSFRLDGLKAWDESGQVFSLNTARPAALSERTHLDNGKLVTSASGQTWEPAAVFKLENQPEKIELKYPETIPAREIRRIALWTNLKDSVLTTDGVMLWLHPWYEADAWFVKNGKPDHSINVKPIYPQTSTKVLFRLIKKHPIKFFKKHFIKEVDCFGHPPYTESKNKTSPNNCTI
ncbi:MAG: glycosyltransferase family 39 protein [candidate division KSB1 bacterium]|nr:glycosyltransferase family 39 protein [candidate division KSB1 bacterium]